MQLQATTVGTGPFKPAIRWDGRVWVLDKEFGNEDLAAVYATKAITIAGDAVNAELTREGFALEPSMV